MCLSCTIFTPVIVVYFDMIDGYITLYIVYSNSPSNSNLVNTVDQHMLDYPFSSNLILGM